MAEYSTFQAKHYSELLLDTLRSTASRSRCSRKRIWRAHATHVESGPPRKRRDAGRSAAWCCSGKLGRGYDHSVKCYTSALAAYFQFRPHWPYAPVIWAGQWNSF
eukprot:6182051-Pleurochrysis_carterae.AAC.7